MPASDRIAGAAITAVCDNRQNQRGRAHMESAQIERWLDQRREKDDHLYERFGRPLERAHDGEFVAIADDGRTILGEDELAVAQQAIERFGRGAFALRRIGAAAEIRLTTGGDA